MNENPWLKSRRDLDPNRRQDNNTETGTNRAAGGMSVPSAPVSPTLPTQVGLPERPVSTSADLWCVGAHGGAGESTLASFDPGWAEADHAWPVSSPTTARCVVVARSNARGLMAAQAALAQWATTSDRDWDVIGLVVMADAPERLPKPLRDLVALVAGGARRCWQVPWVPNWRTDLDYSRKPPRAVQSVVRQLRAAAPPRLDQTEPATG